MLVVLLYLLDQRLSVEAEESRHCAKVRALPLPVQNASNIIAVVAAAMAAFATSSSVTDFGLGTRDSRQKGF